MEINPKIAIPSIDQLQHAYCPATGQINRMCDSKLSLTTRVIAAISIPFKAIRGPFNGSERAMMRSQISSAADMDQLTEDQVEKLKAAGQFLSKHDDCYSKEEYLDIQRIVANIRHLRDQEVIVEEQPEILGLDEGLSSDEELESLWSETESAFEERRGQMDAKLEALEKQKEQMQFERRKERDNAFDEELEELFSQVNLDSEELAAQFRAEYKQSCARRTESQTNVKESWSWIAKNDEQSIEELSQVVSGSPSIDFEHIKPHLETLKSVLPDTKWAKAPQHRALALALCVWIHSGKIKAPLLDTSWKELWDQSTPRIKGTKGTNRYMNVILPKVIKPLMQAEKTKEGLCYEVQQFLEK